MNNSKMYDRVSIRERVMNGWVASDAEKDAMTDAERKEWRDALLSPEFTAKLREEIDALVREVGPSVGFYPDGDKREANQKLTAGFYDVETDSWHSDASEFLREHTTEGECLKHIDDTYRPCTSCDLLKKCKLGNTVVFGDKADKADNTKLTAGMFNFKTKKWKDHK